MKPLNDDAGGKVCFETYVLQFQLLCQKMFMTYEIFMGTNMNIYLVGNYILYNYMALNRYAYIESH